MALVCLVGLGLAACTDPEPLVYTPVDWQADEADDGAWLTTCAGVVLRSYRQVITDPDASTLRLELDLVNRTGRVAGLEESVGLATNGRNISGTIIRLFSPDGLAIADGEQAELAALFDLEPSAGKALSAEIALTITVIGGSRATCTLAFRRENGAP